MQIISLNAMVEPSPSMMIIIYILITIPMLGPECKYLNGPEISFRSEAAAHFAACHLISDTLPVIICQWVKICQQMNSFLPPLGLPANEDE